jgi:hypothetical protein
VEDLNVRQQVEQLRLAFEVPPERFDLLAKFVGPALEFGLQVGRYRVFR